MQLTCGVQCVQKVKKKNRKLKKKKPGGKKKDQADISRSNFSKCFIVGHMFIKPMSLGFVTFQFKSKFLLPIIKLLLLLFFFFLFFLSTVC